MTLQKLAGGVIGLLAFSFAGAAQADLQFGLERFSITYEMTGQINGTRTIYVEDFGARVGIEEISDQYTDGKKARSLYYWDGAASYLKTAPDEDVKAMDLRLKYSEPTAFAVTSARDLVGIGYDYLRDGEVAEHRCQTWINDKFGYSGCRWMGIEFEFVKGDTQHAVATEFNQGAGIPDHLTALAD